MPRRLSIRRRLVRRLPLARRIIAWILLATYATTASGVPLPTIVEATSAGRHPCQSHQCGCATAERCWKSCCCYTNGQKVAWAAEHGVTVPDYVVAAAKLEAKQVEPPAPACCRAKRSCCAKSSAGSQSVSPATTTTTVKCGDSQAEAPVSSSVVYVSLLQADRCRGITPTWGGVAISLPPSPPINTPAFDPQVRLLPAISLPAVPYVLQLPSVPPPRDA